MAIGELLLDLSSPNVLAGSEGPYLFDAAGITWWRILIPGDSDLCGFKFRTQTLELGADIGLHNTQDTAVGFNRPDPPPPLPYPSMRIWFGGVSGTSAFATKG